MSLYDEIGGFDRILTLTRAWHRLCMEHPEASHPFECGIHPHHDVRLAAYLAEAFGGPELYSAGYGSESSVQQIHAGNGVHRELDEACLGLFDQALIEVGVPTLTAAKASGYFRRATEDQRPWGEPGTKVPDGLPFNYAD